MQQTGTKTVYLGTFPIFFPRLFAGVPTKQRGRPTEGTPITSLLPYPLIPSAAIATFEFCNCKNQTENDRIYTNSVIVNNRPDKYLPFTKTLKDGSLTLTYLPTQKSKQSDLGAPEHEQLSREPLPDPSGDEL